MQSVDETVTIDELINLQIQAKGQLEPFERSGLIFFQELAGVVERMRLAKLSMGFDDRIVSAYVADAKAEAGDLILMLSFFLYRSGFEDFANGKDMRKLVETWWGTQEKASHELLLQHAGKIARAGIYAKNHIGDSLIMELHLNSLYESAGKFLEQFFLLYGLGLGGEFGQHGEFVEIMWNSAVPRYRERMEEFEQGILKTVETN